MYRTRKRLTALLNAITNRGLAATISLGVLVAGALPVAACTDFQVKTTNGSVINGRSMEWGANLNSRLVVHPRGEEAVSLTDNGQPAMKWKSKFGYVGVDANNLPVSLDGLNEKGLSFGELWLPGYTQYQNVPPSGLANAIDVKDLCAWVLGNFSTVDEARAGMSHVYVFASPVPSFGGIPTAHVALHDASGKNMVIEFVGGEQKIYDNPIGVLTNAPTFDWHLINLSNYLALDASNPKPLQIAGTVLSTPGQGGGFLGVPGDWTPPSRFVRTAAMLGFAKHVATAGEGVNLAEHILNAVDIPKGAIRETVAGHDYTDYTQWIVIKDLSNKKIYYRSYENMDLRALDLKNLDFTEKSQLRYIPINSESPALSAPKQ